MKGRKVNLSVVIPVYNEQEGLPGVLRDLRAVLKKSSYEIIVVDDGSQDDTVKTAGKSNDIRVLRHPYNKGYGAALKTGIRQARGTWILIVDGDGSYPMN